MTLISDSDAIANLPLITQPRRVRLQQVSCAEAANEKRIKPRLPSGRYRH